ncbi:uncharacterized protein M421DRAFT_419213 [Didymella exigua CBS 183.55]|uniref:Uncharacterized protein n=1 Tax=Didymella exigua CBS 183.55 TaxID=1150837 RepID=A0A6A5RRC1_9PLEO|nr:uncharacterized protein M421DRAFT_419213 [Didymella exigua CBS 183.55]KAF1930169.1 hypothetical protein M421DRAFT_419213 [Didymella exigua CBS 183.55]
MLLAQLKERQRCLTCLVWRTTGRQPSLPFPSKLSVADHSLGRSSTTHSPSRATHLSLASLVHIAAYSGRASYLRIPRSRLDASRY